jgi:ribose transport system ATP-binding protein
LPRPGSRELLSVSHLERNGSFGPISFNLKQGEILGLAGLIGSGRTELVRALIGADSLSSGKVLLSGQAVCIRSPRDAKNLGICLLPEDRKAQGLILGMSVLHNVSLPSLKRLSRLGFIKNGEERDEVSNLIERLNVRTPGLDQLSRNLSGGNQQKLVLAKWLGVNPQVLIFDEPTRGIDVGAKFEVYKLIASLARQGTGIILISSELPEILGLSHRVGVMRGGHLAAVLPRREATAEKVMHYAMGVVRA